ncbi:immunoglobulin superfamily member 8 [Polyodon spathula]|uniref:immunoglobulin superfamily member 8 n=1 Tax=Polyodon spathula TaxID=7913 RepID=UPI001B7EEF48|nr:immunoglobulin superfamily member 8 [Polyodon spathula]
MHGDTAVSREAMLSCVLLLWAAAVCVCREVFLPPGPLYRVAGFPLSLPCSVSGYEGSRTQDFEWFLYRTGSGGHPIGVISTRDRGFPYAPFLERVKEGEVRVERDSGDAVRLVIQRLRTEDQGTWECYTPSTDSRYLGNYSAKVPVRVIPDSLKVNHTPTPQAPPFRSLGSQSLPEGAGLELTCAASVKSEQHTHLSVTFVVQGAGGAGVVAGEGGSGHDVRDVISIGRDLGVYPGRGGLYERRYAEGGVSVEKRTGQSEGEGDLYSLRIASLQPSDSGVYFCKVSQWINDPEGSWERVAQRTVRLGSVVVQPITDSLSVSVSPQGEVSLPAGSPLSLSCEVGGLSPASRPSVLVQWLRGLSGGAELAVVRLGPDGVVTWGDGDVVRRGGASFEKEAEGRYTLRFYSAHPVDSGVYRCAVSVYTGQAPPTGTPAASQRSRGVNVSLRTKAVTVTAQAGLAPGPPLNRGHTFSLLCNISIATTGPAQAAVKWLVMRVREGKEEPGKSRLLAVLRHDGTSRLYSNGSDVSVDRPAPSSYRLRVHRARQEDQGLYRCQVEVWGMDQHGGWFNTGAHSHSNTVRVYMYLLASDLLFIPVIVGVATALFVGVAIVASVTCCFMNRLARKGSRR